MFPVCPIPLTLICMLLFFALCLSAHLFLLTCRHTDPQAEAVVQTDLHLPLCHQQLSRGIRGWHSPGLWVRTAWGSLWYICAVFWSRQTGFLCQNSGVFPSRNSFYAHIPKKLHCSCSHTMYFSAIFRNRCAQKSHSSLPSTKYLSITNVFHTVTH